MMNENALAIVEPDRDDSLNVPLLRSWRESNDMVSVRYGALVQLASGLSGRTLDDVASDLAAGLHDAVEFDLLHVVILGCDSGGTEPTVFGRSTLLGVKVWTDEARSRWVSEHQQPLRLGDSDDGAVGRFGRRAGDAQVCRSFCGVPLRVALRPVGALCVATRSVHAYSDADERFLRVIADRVALVVDGLLARGHVGTEPGRASAGDGAGASLAGTELERARHSKGPVLLGAPVPEDVICEGMVGRSAVLREVVMQLETVASTDSTVLICGETGTGKELIARAVHNLSARRANPFVKCNCAAIPTGLLESELFGHEKGAFTGAVAQRIGRFELANRGTIFLDEIGEAPLELQPKLLRVLQEREFERLGNSRTQHTDARVVAATNVDLPEMVDAKRFRADLFYRLNVFPIQIPPLRDRPEDIPLLVTHFAHDCARRLHRTITRIPSATMEALLRYSWPGNIRELQNLIERAVILSSGEVLQVPLSQIDDRSKTSASQQTLEEVERAHILATLKKTRWTLSGPRGAANRLGIKRSTLQFRMKKLGIARPSESDEVTHLM
jgi:formate hydrogenlyase transcriptional activator